MIPLVASLTGTASNLKVVDSQCGRSGGIGASSSGTTQKTLCCKFFEF